MTDAINVLFKLSVLIFVLTSMFDLGLGLTLKQVFSSLRNTSLIIRALVVNFILAPALAFGLVKLIGLDQQLAIGLFILGTTAGSPFLAKLVQMAKGDTAFTLGFMVLLMVVTIIYAPLVLPLLMSDVQVDVWGMIRSLVLTMLVPLAAGLFIKARYESLAESLSTYMSQTSSLTLIVSIVLGVFLTLGDIVDLFGTGAFLATILFITGNLVLGWFLGGRGRGTRVVMTLGTAQRNVSAAMLIVAENFDEPQVLLMVLTGAILMLIINSLLAGEFGRRYKAKESRSQSV